MNNKYTVSSTLDLVPGDIILFEKINVLKDCLFTFDSPGKALTRENIISKSYDNDNKCFCFLTKSTYYDTGSYLSEMSGIICLHNNSFFFIPNYILNDSKVKKLT